MRAGFILILLITAFAITHVPAQNPRVVDSLNHLISTAKEDTIRVLRMMDLAWHYRDSKPEQYIELTNRALEKSKQIHYKFGISKGYILLGVINTIQGDFTRAEEYYLKCKKVKAEMGDSLGIASVLNNIGLIHLYLANFDKALSYFLQSVILDEKFGDKQTVSEDYVNIGNVYMGMKNYNKALEYYLKYQEMNKGMGNKFSIPEVYNNMGQAFLMKNEFEKAIGNFENGLTVSKETGNRNMEAASMAGIAAIRSNEEKYAEAVDLMKKSISIHEEIDNKEELTNSLNQLGSIYNKIKRYDEAIGVLYRSISISRKIGLKKNIANAYASIAESYEKKNDFENAYRSMYYYSAYTDSVLNESNNRLVAEMEGKFQNEKTEKENLLLSQENEVKELALEKKQTQLYLLIGALAIIILGSGFLYSRSKLKQQKAMNEEILRQEKLRLHAVINTQEEEQKRIAAELHDGLGSMLSAARINLASIEEQTGSNSKIKTTLDVIDESCRELRNISHNMMPALLIKSGLYPALDELFHRLESASGIRFTFDHDPEIPDLNSDTSIHLYRIIQELIHNIIKYAEASEVHVSANVENKMLTLMIEDNGKGFNPDLLKNSIGNGWYNINSRLQLISGEIEMDSQPGNGTVATITLPV